MRNDELFSPNCKNDRLAALVKGYVMRGLLSSRGTYSPKDLLARQHAIYEEWLETARKLTTTRFYCGFYEWMSRDCDAAFILKPGDLVKCNDRYYVVDRRRTSETWTYRWHLRDGEVVQEPWPKPMREVELKDSDGRVFTTDVVNTGVRPADIPHEVFELACGKAKDCPMMKGGVV